MTMVNRKRKIAPTWVRKCLFLGALATMAMLFSGFHLLITLVVFVVSLFGARELWRIVTDPGKLRFSEVLSISILLGYVVGTGISMLYLQTTKITDFQYFQYFGIYYDQESLGFALAAVLLSSALLYAASAWETPKRALASIAELSTTKAERLVWLGLLLAVLALYAGQIGYMGTTTAESGRITALGALAVMVTPPLVPYTLALAAGDRPFTKRCLLWAGLLLLTGVTVMLGRRYLLYAIALSAMVLFARGYHLSLRRLGMIALLGTIALIVLYWGFKFFMALRLAVWQLGPDAGLWEQVGMALSMLGGDQSKEVGERLAENAGTRTFILSYFAGLVGISNGNLPTLGKELLYSVEMAVPSLLMPGKTFDLPSSPEEFMHPLYGIPVFDGPNSIVVAGYDDFGFVGVALYPVALVVLFASFYGIICRMTRQQPIRLFVLFALLFQLLYIEQSLTASFVTLRNLVILVALFSILMRMPGVRFSKPAFRYKNREGSWPTVARSTFFVEPRERR